MHVDINGFYQRRSDLFTICQFAVQSCVRYSLCNYLSFLRLNFSHDNLRVVIGAVA